MLVVTARLFKDNQLVGYRFSDGQTTQDLTKQQAWAYAKNKQIVSVVATGTEIFCRRVQCSRYQSNLFLRR